MTTPSFTTEEFRRAVKVLEDAHRQSPHPSEQDGRCYVVGANEQLVNAITQFRGANRFLSNMWPCLIDWAHKTYASVEHAYQASKTLDIAERQQILREPDPVKAKAIGQTLTRRKDWDKIKLEFMERMLQQKFTRHPELRQQLLDTQDARLIEGNTWHDNFWGACFCDACGSTIGRNHLGKLLMRVRDDIRNGQL